MNNTQRISALESSVANIERMVAQLVQAQQPAKVARPKAVTAKAAKRTVRKPQPKADLALCKATRVRFVAAAAKEGWDFAGMSTKAIAAMCVEADYAPKGFHIGAGYTQMFSA